MEPIAEAELFAFSEGTRPILLSIPHDGRLMPAEMAARMTEAGRANTDADWHVTELYDFAAGLGASVLVARQSRYVVDVNRDPADVPLYGGAVDTGVVPRLTFDGRPLYRAGAEPDGAERAARVATYWRPYHKRMATTLAAMRARFGGAVLFDAHSIRSRLPRLFDGTLPDFNLGTVDGTSAGADLIDRVWHVLDGAPAYSAVLDGRFKGGHVTRAHGDPANAIHALQLELSQATYMAEEPPFDLLRDKVARLEPVLRAAFAAALGWAAESFAGEGSP